MCNAGKAYKLDVKKEKVEEFALEFNIVTVSVDLIYWNAIKNAVKNLGPIDCLVNWAGITILEPSMEVKPESLDWYVL